jgi:predicted restriction endonuclease
MITCSKCGLEQPFENYHAKKEGKFGKNSRCKTCIKTYHAQHYQEALEINRNAYARKMADPEKRRLERERNKQWKKNHPEETKAQNKRYAERRKQWKQPRFETELLTDRHWVELLEYYNYRCAYCFETADVLEQEHKTPLSRGGNHTVSNVVPACGACNRRKGEKTVQEWLGGI